MEDRHGLSSAVLVENLSDYSEDEDSSSSSSSSSTSCEQGRNEDLEEMEESRDEGDPNEKEWVQETSEKMTSACRSYSWETFEEFLSDKTISKRKKKLVLDNTNCRDFALKRSPRLKILKNLVKIEGQEPITSCWNKEGIHSSVMSSDVSYEYFKLLVDMGMKNLFTMKAITPHLRGKSPFHIYLGRGGKCPKSIDVFVQEGGIELLEMIDEDGYSVLDHCNKSQRALVVLSCQKFLYNFPNIDKQIENLQSDEVTPKEIEDWIREWKQDDLSKYLDNKDIPEDSKKRCFMYREPLRQKNLFQVFCRSLGPPGIAKRIIDLMGTEILFDTIEIGSTCLHDACEPFERIDLESLREEQCALIDYLISCGGKKLLFQSNNNGHTALHKLLELMHLEKPNIDAIKLISKIGGKDLLLIQNDRGETALHLASILDEQDQDKEIISLLLHYGGPSLRDIKDKTGSKAEEYWSEEVEEYINLSIRALPALSRDLECPICYHIMSNIHFIPQCCHRFCKKCLEKTFRRNGDTCPVCRTQFVLGDVRKDPLLGNFAIVAKEKEDENQRLKKEIQALREKLKRKHDEL